MATQSGKSSPRTPFISPNELAIRWRMSRPSADRIARQNGFVRVCLGHGHNGTIRYRVDDVLRFEQERSVVSATPS